MTDLVDEAQALEQALRDDALANRHRRYADPQGAIRPKDCAVCHAPIPAERLAHVPLAIRCTPCQARHEATYHDVL
ncbi:TraR/DksA C4-type zinc finger protein [Nitrospirillum viridazoti]|uniref:TraR/DksA C4-type zinc finger protein n=1 Tax=Nitrospirillum viridazoti TaxID=3144925 RepID=UPI0009DA19C2|nr:TraR/DksA C4-type zinc finger protein [Nitrospirillum amazonense]